MGFGGKMKKRLVSLLSLWLIAAGVPGALAAPASNHQAAIKVNEDLEQALVNAAYDGDLKRVQALVAQGASLKSVSDTGTTALMAAAWVGHQELVSWLLGRGAVVDAQNNDGFDALMYAVWNNHVEVARLLVKHGADVKQKSPQDVTLVMVAAELGHLEALRWLVEDLQLDVSPIDSNYADALMHAVWKNQLETARYLVAHGGNLKQTWDGTDMLMYLAPHGHLPIARWLVEEQDSDVLKISDHGFTALSLAARAGHQDLVEYLIARGADPYVRDNSGHTVLMFATLSENEALVKWLLDELRLDPNLRDKDGESALEYAYSGSPIISLLRNYGATDKPE